MSTLFGTKDWQEISRWVGPILDQQTAYAIGAGVYNTATFQVGSFESCLLVCKPTGGTITATFTSTIAEAPAALAVAQVVRFAAGVVGFQAVPNVGDQVQVALQGSAAGETVSFALIETNAGAALAGATQVVTGIVSGAGAILAGTGFTVNRTGVGVYVVTYTVPFASTPVVVTQKADFTDNFPNGISAQSASAFTLNMGGPADHAFNFLATPMV